MQLDPPRFDSYSDSPGRSLMVLGVSRSLAGLLMVLILDGNSEHAAQAYRKINLFGPKSYVWLLSMANQMP